MKNRKNSAWAEEMPKNLKEGSKANKEFISYIIIKRKEGFSFRWNGEYEEYVAPRSSRWFPVPATHHWEF